MYGGAALNNENLLHYASTYGSKEICLFLIENGLDVNSVDDYYITPLTLAAKCGRYDLVKLLIEKGAKVNGDSRCALTPLISTVSNSHTDVAKYLLEQGADVNRLQANFNRSALDFAKDEEIVRLLKSNGALKAHETLDLLSERASGVISHIHNNAGWVLSTKLSKGSVDIRTALLRENEKYKVLFTIGMFERFPRVELMMCLRHSWVVNNELATENNIESFPIQILFCLAECRLNGNEIHEGFLIEKNNSKWKHLMWPEKIDAFVVINYKFSKELKAFEFNEDTVDLLMLVPIKYPKTGCPKGKKLEEWIKKRQTVKWVNNALKYEHLC